MEFGVLGPVHVSRGDGLASLTGRKQRVLLAMLLVRANASVSTDLLVDALWDGQPVERAPQNLQVHVHRLRRVLDDPRRLTYGASGYRLEVLPGELDADRFESLVAEAMEIAGQDPRRCVDLVRKALGLWRGQPYEALDVPELTAARERLSQRRLAAIEQLYEAELSIGGNPVGELADLVRENPLRERLHALLMAAHARAGRPADALRVYQDARRVLVDELGMEPGPQLQAVHRQILDGEPVDLGVRVARPPAPAQLPIDVGGFVGRDAELRGLDDVLTGDRAAVGIAVLTGTAGVGKTAAAVHWAHRVRDQFPDGQLYANLHGYGPEPPASPEQILAGFLRALGVDGAGIPIELAERSARFRSLVDGRRILLVLDNASTADQVRPLLPGAGSCAVVVTSRDSMIGLAVREGAHRIDLDRLSAEEAVRLIDGLLGGLAAASPEATVRLIEQCARLPLALRIAADLVRTRPARGVAGLVYELADERHRLDTLDVDDDAQSAVRVVFSWSYQQLSSKTMRVFRMCGLHPGRTFDALSLAALAGCGRRDAEGAIGVLMRAHLVDELPRGRFQLHDLLRAYARDLVEGAETATERGAALSRLYDYYIATASVAADLAGLVEPEPRHSTTLELPTLDDQEDGLAWLDAERSNLLAAAGGCGPTEVLAFAGVLRNYLNVGAYLDDAMKLQTRALDAARDRGDKSAEADALRFLGTLKYARGQYAAATSLFEQAQARYLELGDLTGQAAAANTLGGACWIDGRTRAAVDHFERAAVLFRETGHRQRQVSPMANLAYIHGRIGNYQRAFEYASEALAIAEEHRDRNGQAHALINLVRLSEAGDRLDDALEYGHQVLPLVRDGGVRFLRDEALNVLGAVYRRRGENERALRCLGEALEHAREAGKKAATAQALNGLAAIDRAVGEPNLAVRGHREALDLAIAAGVRHEQARALDGIGDASADLGADDVAREHWRRALVIYRELELVEAESTQSKLEVSA